MKVLTVVLLLISLQCSCAVSPTDCDAVEPVAEKALDLINKWRRNGYLFQLLRVADAHLDRAGSTAVYYLVLDVKESDCWVLSRNQEDCIPAEFRRPSDTVIGQCKVIVTKYSNESQDLRMNDFNCTTSSVSSALGNSKDSPVILDFLEDTELYREQADKALDKYKSENSDFDSFRVDRVERVARAIFGFCRADLSYDVGASDLEALEKLDVNCEVFNFEEIDCDDEDVFKAVDAALKKYNSRNQSGNQFVLYRIIEVNKTVDPETFYSFKYQIKEGDCPVQSGKTWQDCDYKGAEEAATGECTATVGKRGSTKFSVATQICQITPAEGPVLTAQYICHGCVHPISTESPDLDPILKHAIQHFNNNTNHSYLFALGEVKRAQRQDMGECTDSAFVDPQLRIASFSQNCDIYPGEDFVQPHPEICPGCPLEIPVDSPELKEALTHSIAKLNAENNETFYFKIDTVKRAAAQMTWMKRPPGFSPFRLSYPKKTRGGTTVSLPYTSMAPVQDEEQDPEKEEAPTRGRGQGREKKMKHGLGHGHKYEHEQGRGHQRGHGLGHGPRKQYILGHGQQQQHDLDHGHQPKLDFDLEHGLDHGYKHKLKHGHGHGHGKHKNKDKNNGKLNDQRPEHLASSSEDSTTSSTQTQEKTEGPTLIPSLAQPGVAVTFSAFQDSDLIEVMTPPVPPTPTENDDDWIPDIQIEPNSLSFESIPDFPETKSPKCPGRPWKPVNGKNPTMEMKEFHDFDLSDAL
ncbi:Kininogen-1 [Sciurus carolinensis]|uniref:Kininogen-1 n=1 Tax=Sciurus carolinensis TaxID=30640 RepID=A0AA41NC71_SCICA|nr:Kininogen-1 [Sciurus carolinensis]